MFASSRNTYIDVLKGLLIFSVVMTHSAAALKIGMKFSLGPYPFIPYFIPFDMPMFMAISGYFFYSSCCKRSWQETVVNRFKMVFIPWIVWCWIVQLVRLGITHHFSSLKWMPVGIWFPGSLLGCCALTLLLHIALGRKGWLGALVLVGMSLFIGQDYYNIGYMFPFFYLGYLTSQRDLLSRFRWWHGALALVVYFGLQSMLGMPWAENCSIWKSHTYLFGPLGVLCHARLYLYRMSLGFFGCISFAWVIWVLCRCCRHLPQKSIACRAIHRFLLACGEYSLAIYLIQSVLVEEFLKKGFLWVVYHLGYNPVLESSSLFFFVILPGTTIIFLLLCLVVHRLLSGRKNVALILFGK